MTDPDTHKPYCYPGESPEKDGCMPENRIDPTAAPEVDPSAPAAGGWTPRKIQRVVLAFFVGCGTGAGTAITAAAAQPNFTMQSLNAGVLIGACVVGGFSAVGYELGMRSAGTRKL